jgi:tetratricopeptide (TPR) repeat protein
MKLPFLLCFFLGTLNCIASEDLGEIARLYAYGKFRQAADSLAEKIRSTPANAELHFWLGKSCYKMRRWDDAIREFETAVRLNPDNSAYHLWLGRACGQKASHISFFSALGWARRVIKEFQTAERLAPNDIDVRFDSLDYYLRAPGIVGGGMDKAEVEVNTIAKISPNLGYLARAAILRKDKKWDPARAELEKAIQAYPSDADRYEDLADFLFQRQDYRNAESIARKALTYSQLLPKSLLICGASLVKTGKSLSEAEEILKRISVGPLDDNGPSFEEVYYWLGEAYLKQGKRENAIQAFTTALEFNPDFDMAKDALHQTRQGV